jgi:predicted alpha/beta-fold hydrolase
MTDDVELIPPLSRVSDIRVPVLIAQAATDPRVKQADHLGGRAEDDEALSSAG